MKVSPLYFTIDCAMKVTHPLPSEGDTGHTLYFTMDCAMKVSHTLYFLP